jgi:hypothetical protein
MINRIASGTSPNAALESAQLAHQAWVVEQPQPAAVEQWDAS